MESPDAREQATPTVTAPVSGWIWVRRYLQSNLVALLFCAFLFFFILRDQLSLEWREAAAGLALGCWQLLFLVCVLVPRRLPWLWSAARNTAVALFVGWQLFFLFVRNPLDFWYKPIKSWCEDQGIWTRHVGPWLDPVDDATRHYGNFNGIDQDWRMFTPPLSRSAVFLAARVEFTDGSDEVVLSEEEPDPRSFYRFGGWRQRKLEYQLAYKTAADLPSDDDLPLCEAYARRSLRRWRDAHPDDPRTPARVVLLRREIALPAPGTDPTAFPPADVSVIGTFLPDGSLAP